MSKLSVFQGKVVLITGHTGFKGIWLSEILLQLGAVVHGVSLECMHQRQHFDALNHKNRVHNSYLDITDPSLSNIINSIEPDFVFHLAAESIVSRCIQNPTLAFSTNVLGTINLLNSLRSLQKPCVSIFITSDKCYENVEWNYGYREIDKLGGKDPYSASKACAEISISAFFRTYFASGHHKMASARAGNVIGGGDFSPNRLIPDFVRSIQSGQPFIIRSPHSVRPWQHCLDPLMGYLRLALNLYDRTCNDFDSYNFGPSALSPLTVSDVISLFAHYLETDPPLIDSPTDESFLLATNECKLLTLNTDKANTELGWKPIFSQTQSIELTAQWYYTLINGSDVAPLTTSQIHQVLSSYDI